VLPGIVRQAGLLAGLLDKDLRTPLPHGRHLRQQQSSMETLLNEQAMATNLDFVGGRNRLERTKNGYLDVERRNFRLSDGWKSRIGAAGQARTLRDRLRQWRVGFEMSDAPSKIAELMQADKDAGATRQRATRGRPRWNGTRDVSDDGRAGYLQEQVTIAFSRHDDPNAAAR